MKIRFGRRKLTSKWCCVVTITTFILIPTLCIRAQQNFINVPSGEVTLAHRWFFQQQINANQLLQSNTTIDYGLGRNWEIGMNVLGLNIRSNNFNLIENDSNDIDPYNPLLLLNALKRIPLNERLALAAGIQYGGDFTVRQKIKPCGFTYLNLSAKDVFFKENVVVAGVYYNSLHYGGKGNRWNGMLGYEQTLSPRWHVMAETILGTNALAYTSLGLIYYPKSFIAITAGVQIPNTAKNSFGFVIELTILPKH